MTNTMRAFFLILATAFSGSATAYVGPGAGLSLLGALWGLLVALVAALAFVVLWPLRRLMKQRAQAAQAAKGAVQDPQRRDAGEPRRQQQHGRPAR
jgi:membrane protein implicated in regulation of membrane protease activity